MKIDEIKLEIEKSKFKSDLDIKQLIKLVLHLYKTCRVDNTDLEEEGDMLIFQWGSHHLNENDYFTIDITRQIIYKSDEDIMQQLEVIFKYPANLFTPTFSADNQWCAAPNEVNDFEGFIEQNNAFKWAIKNKPLAVGINLSYL